MTQTTREHRSYKATESPVTPPFDPSVDLDRSEQSDHPELHLIAGHALFEGIPLDILEPLVTRCEIRQLQIGEILLAPGQTNRTLYLLLDGQLKAHIDRFDSDDGFVIEPGECTGEISVIDCRPATAFVVAEEQSKVLALPESALWEEFLGIPQIAKNFMRLFADRFRARTRLMQQALEQQLRYEHLQKELAIAQEIQLGMLPHDIDLAPEIDIAVEIRPAQLVGGDFYDVFPVSPEEHCVIIGDVSGKGVPAALFMVRTLTLLRTELLKAQPLEEAVRNVNLKLCEENAACMFATLIVAIADMRTGSLRYINGGHDPILFGHQGISYQSLPPPSGILIGLDEDANYAVASLTLKKGDVVVLYTDGITEAMNDEHHLFTLDRLVACLDRSPALSARELADQIGVAVREFTAGAPQSDDVTLMILKYQGT
jgi:phosphoserine phosphatase RsbU/P